MATWRLMVARRKYTRRPKTQYFQTKKPEKPRTSGAMSFGLRDALLYVNTHAGNDQNSSVGKNATTIYYWRRIIEYEINRNVQH